MVYKTRGVCSQEIHFDVKDHKLTNEIGRAHV